MTTGTQRNRNAQLLIQILIEHAVNNGLFHQKRLIHLQQMCNSRCVSVFGLQQYIFKSHSSSPPSKTRSLAIVR